MKRIKIHLHLRVIGWLLLAILLVSCAPWDLSPGELLSPKSGSPATAAPNLISTKAPAPAASSQPQLPPPTLADSIPFQESDCSCIGLKLASVDGHNPHSLTCNFEWLVKVGGSEDTAQVQTNLAAWTSLDEAQKSLAAEAASFQSAGDQVTFTDGQSIYDIQPLGTGGFYYGEGRRVYAEGYSLSTHLRGYYAAGDALAILHQADQCMQVALNLHHR